MRDLIGPSRVRFGTYEADLHTRELWKFGTRVKLVGQPFDILEVLVSKPGELVTRDELRERLWPRETFVDFNHGLNAAMNKLRDVLCDSADDPKFIETLPRRGYRFVAKVERGAPEAVVAVPTMPSEPEPKPAELAVSERAFEPVAPKKGRRLIWPFWVAGALAGSILLFAVFLSILKVSSSMGERVRKGEQNGAAVVGLTKGAQVVVATGGHNEGPQFSPDGKRIVFMSNWSGGGTDLWIASASGGEPKQLTTLRSAGTPRWSPDGKEIAFDSQVNSRSAILVVDANGGPPRFMVADNSNNSVPSWSRDGKYLYFASDRTGRYEVWKQTVENGAAEQVTRNGGFAAFEAADGQTVYYAKNQFPQPEIWQVRHGVEAPVWPMIHSATWASWGLSDRGLFYVEEGPGDVAILSQLEVPAQRMRQITMIGRFPFWLGVSNDGKKVAFDRSDSEETTSIVELEDFE